MKEKDYARCLELADRGQRLVTHTATRVVFLEWTAISLHGLHVALDGVRLYLEEALSLDSMNENVRSSLQALDQGAVTAGQTLTTRVVPDPSEVLRDLRNQLQPAA